jgi:hypothetical protein
MHNRVWMIEFSCECDFMLHNAWLDIVFSFFLLKWLVINIPEGVLTFTTAITKLTTPVNVW